MLRKDPQSRRGIPFNMILFSVLNCCLLMVVVGMSDLSMDISFRLETENTLSCKDKNKKTLKEIEDAQLAAHRCMIRDVPVKVPEPDDFIAEYIFPSHIVVPRCTGVCLEKSGYSCHPKKKTKLVSHEVVLYSLNGTQVCRTVELEHHKGPCKCSCQITAADCGPAQYFESDECRCSCHTDRNPAKYACAQERRRVWNERECRCVCEERDCPVGEKLNIDNCRCEQVPATCQLSPINIEGGITGAHTARFTTYIGIGALSLVAMTIIVTLYFMLARKRPYTDLRTESSPTVPSAAYTITINQAAHTAEDSNLALTAEDKTRF